MTQSQYEEILSCIKFGAPASADSLSKALNFMMQLANERLAQMKQEAEKSLEKQEEKVVEDKKEKE